MGNNHFFDMRIQWDIPWQSLGYINTDVAHRFFNKQWLASGKLTVCSGESLSLIGKSPTHGPCSIANC